MKDEELVVYCDPKLKMRQILRKYIDLTKFVDFLRTSELHLEPASNFEPLEGTLSEKIRKSICNYLSWEQKNKNRTCLSCWTLGAEDNMALWKIYGSTTKSVAVTTTVNRMISATLTLSWVKFGKVNLKKVQYINHAGPLPNGVYTMDDNLFGLKHVAYSFEKEVRIVLTRPIEETPVSIRLPVNINQFLTKIVVAPEAGDWFFNIVVDVTRKYNVAVPVQRSKLTFLLNKAKVSTNKTSQSD